MDKYINHKTTKFVKFYPPCLFGFRTTICHHLFMICAMNGPLQLHIVLVFHVSLIGRYIMLLLLLIDPSARELLPFGSVTYGANGVCFKLPDCPKKSGMCVRLRLLDLLTLCSRTGGVQLSLSDGYTKGMLIGNLIVTP